MTTIPAAGSGDAIQPGGAADARRRGGRSAPTRRGRRHHRGVSYETSLVLSLSLLVVATGLAVSLLAFRGARTGTAQLANDLFQEVSDHAVTKTRAFLERAVPVAQALGDLSELGLATDDRDRLARQLAVVVRANPGVGWASYGTESGDFVGAYRTPAGQLRVNQSRIMPDGRTTVVEHDVMPDGTWRPFRTDDDSRYDPRQRPYYLKAKQYKRLVWTEPYVFYDQGVPGVTCANPLFDVAGNLRGVLTVDFDLATLSTFVERQSESPNSRLFIMTPDGTLLAHPAHRMYAEALERAAADTRAGRRGKGELLKVREMNDPLLTTFAGHLPNPDDVRANADGTDQAWPFEFQHNGTDYYARATAFTISGDLVWIVGAVAPQSDFLGAARRATLWSVAGSLGAVLVAVAVAMVLARRVSGPILSLVSFMDGVVREGDLKAARPTLGGAREFHQLSDALDRMLHDLRDRTRLRGDMAVAMEIQQGLLPKRAPHIDGLDVHGFSHYCDETGGDYFDFIILDRNSGRRTEGGGTGVGGSEGLLVAIGDVVGHGIGSALVMAGARGVLHSYAAGCGHLGQLMTHLNEQLVPDLEGMRFVTMLLWYVDPRRGTVCWANAGHDPALVYDPQTGEFEESGRGGIPLGIDAGFRYEERGFGPVRPGQVIVLGTDGVWETMNAAGDLFGRDRLKDVIRDTASGSAADIAAAVRRSLDAFRGGGHQRDDVTLVIIKVTREA